LTWQGGVCEPHGTGKATGHTDETGPTQTWNRVNAPHKVSTSSESVRLEDPSLSADAVELTLERCRGVVLGRKPATLDASRTTPRHRVGAHADSVVLARVGEMSPSRTRRRGRVVVALAVTALASAVAAASASPRRDDSLTPMQRSTLLAQYLPVLYFHSEEEWSPLRVERFLTLARIERQTVPGTWTLTTSGFPTSTVGCTLKPCYRLNLPCSLKAGDRCYERIAPSLSDWKNGYIYGRVIDVPDATPRPPGISIAARYLVRYWLFYAFDDWRSRNERLWQAHEADWESVSVALDENLDPIFAAYSQHCSGTVRPWAKVHRSDTHPVDYVALGSHANYFDKTSSPTQFLRCVYKNVANADRTKARRIVGAVQSGITDRTGTGHVLGLAADQPASLQLVELQGTLPTWARFPGRWSEGELLWAGRTPTRFTRVRSGAGPATPKWNTTAVPALWHTDSS
jgi:hypothetical protein